MNFLFTKTPLVWLFQSYWRDEAFSVVLAQKPIVELLRVSASDFSPPLYYLFLKFWISLFGNSEVATRSLSVFTFLGLAALLLGYLKLSEKFGYIRLLVVGIFLASTPILTYYAFETRMYSLAALFALCSWLALFGKRKKLFIVTTLLGLYTHYFHILLIVPQILYLIVSEIYFDKKISVKVALQKVVVTWGSQFLIIAILFAPWAFFVVVSHIGVQSSFWIKVPSLGLVLNFPAVLTSGFENSFNIKYNLLLLSVPVYILVLQGCLRVYKTNPRHLDAKYIASVIWFLFPPLFISVLSLFGPPLYLPRYLIVATPAYLFFVAAALKEKVSIFSFLIIGLILLQLNHYQGLQIKNRLKENIKSVFEKINLQTDNNAVLYLESELDYHLAMHYFRNPDKVFVVGKQYSELPAYVGKALIPEGKVSKQRPSTETGYWLRSDRSTPIIAH